MTAGQLLVFLAAVVALVAGQCGKPPTLENGTPTGELNETYPVGTKVRYTCYPGYVFKEFSKPWIVCQDNSTWSPLQATCNPKSCGSPGEILNGYYNATGNTFGSTVHFFCNKGYKLVGRATRLCEADGWTGQVPTCEVVKCPNPPPIANGTVSDLGNREFWEYGMVASYSCAPGLLLVGAAKITCEASGQWSASPPTCKGQCGKPPTLENGTPRDQLNETFPVGTKVRYTCYPGYVFKEFSKPWIVCQDNSTWSPLQATCNPKSCGSPGEILNGYYNATGNTFGSTVHFFCNKGYKLVGRATRLCEADGWTGQVPTCEVVKCPNPPPIANGTVSDLGNREFWEYGMVASYSCAPGLLLVGAAKITCEASGQWSASPPTCKGQCGKPPTLENGTPRDQLNETFPVGTKVRYTCYPGYVFKEFSKPWIVCQDNSTWSPLQATCNPKSCGSPGEILNGYYNATGNTFGSTVHFFCNKGYKLVGRATRLCEADGWTGQVPTCEVVKCPNPPPIANGTVSDLGNREFWEYGMVASYSCAPGLLLVGAAKITCEASGQWSASPPTCKGQCGKPPTLENGTPRDQLNETFPVGTKVYYTCHPSYVLQESNTPWAVCQDNSTWSLLRARCNPASTNTTSTPTTGGNNTTATPMATTTATTSGSVRTSVGHQYILFLILTATIYPVFNHD
ncbi:C4b-binding protein-like [Hemitrygon akajei]|uniref:C4b-binding protein-like n=1 Tax=Hemitrygon akajei TaxID=2704970 RepID=UPI003BF9AA8E